MSTNSRLTFVPGEGWMVEEIDEGAVIKDFYGLTSKGAAMRYSKKEILESLCQAIKELAVA